MLAFLHSQTDIGTPHKRTVPCPCKSAQSRHQCTSGQTALWEGSYSLTWSIPGCRCRRWPWWHHRIGRNRGRSIPSFPWSLILKQQQCSLKCMKNSSKTYLAFCPWGRSPCHIGRSCPGTRGRSRTCRRSRCPSPRTQPGCHHLPRRPGWGGGIPPSGPGLRRCRQPGCTRRPCRSDPRGRSSRRK